MKNKITTYFAKYYCDACWHFETNHLLHMQVCSKCGGELTKIGAVEPKGTVLVWAERAEL